MIEYVPLNLKPTKNTVRVDILIPTDRTRSLEKALVSAAGQTYRELEIVVIDNGTSDAARNLVADLNAPSVRYRQNERNIYLIGSIRKGTQLFSNVVSWSTIFQDDDLLGRDFVESSSPVANKLSPQVRQVANKIKHTKRLRRPKIQFLF